MILRMTMKVYPVMHQTCLMHLNIPQSESRGCTTYIFFIQVLDVELKKNNTQYKGE